MDAEKIAIIRIIDIERKKIGSMITENKKIKGGNIKKRRKGNKYYYTECIRGKEYGITNNLERIHSLYRKRYLKTSIIRSKTIVKYLEKLLEDLEKVPLFNNSLNVGIYSIEEWQWMKADYETNSLYPERLQYKSLLGTMVRSKSELNIANTLERLGIPYRYEQKFYFNGVTLYPDFTILLFDGNIVIWEHNGLMDDDSYANRSYKKTREYEKAGFRQHKNLIITYEDDIRSPEQIEDVIKRYIFV